MRNKIKNVIEIENPMAGGFGFDEENQSFKSDNKWFNFLWFFICFSLFFLAGRVFYLTIIKGDYYSSIAEGNSIHSVPILASRGQIFDKNGKILAKNVPNQSIVTNPNKLLKVTNLENEEEIANVFNENEKIAKILQEKVNLDFQETLTKIDLSVKNKESLILKENISHEEYLIISGLAQDLPGIEVQDTALREYVNGELFSHIIGYEGLIKKEEWESKKNDYLLNDRIGKAGIEIQYEDYLKGKHGFTQSIVDSRGRLIRKLKDESAKKGSDIFLNIDADLQEFATKTLKKQLEKAKTEKGVVIAMNPKNGAILAMVSLPSYDNNLFARGISSSDYNSLITDKNIPLFNRAISGTYAPGSTVKPIVALATLKEKIVSPDYEIESKGSIKVGNFTFGDWATHGFTDMRRAIAVSSDVYFYTVGGGYGDTKGLGIAKMKEYMEKFGYGKKTGIDLQNEVSGLYPDPQWKEEKIGEKWYLGDTYHVSIGQGYVLSTPLQVLNSISSIANGGTLYKPKIVSHTIDSDGNKTEIQPEIIAENLATKSEIKVIQEGMRQTVTNGTATRFKNLPVEVAGKTGTAEFGMTKGRVHSWFVSYAPYEDPDFALVVMVENQSEEISSSASPVAYEIYDWYFGGRKNEEK